MIESTDLQYFDFGNEVRVLADPEFISAVDGFENICVELWEELGTEIIEGDEEWASSNLFELPNGTRFVASKHRSEDATGTLVVVLGILLEKNTT
jgi:hypothetical protein